MVSMLWPMQNLDYLLSTTYLSRLVTIAHLQRPPDKAETLTEAYEPEGNRCDRQQHEKDEPEPEKTEELFVEDVDR